MRLRSLYLKSLRDQRWQIAGFGVALGAMAAAVVFLWPAYDDQLALIELPPALQALLGNDLSIATPAGFINAEFFTWTPVLLIIYGIIQGTGAIAGEESAGTADLLLAQPVRRSEVVLARIAATMTGMLIIISLGYAGFAIAVPFIEIDITLWQLWRGCINLLPIGAFFFALALWLGAVAPSRAYAAGVATAIATFAFFADSMAAGVGAIDWLRYTSPYYYFGRGLPLVEGIDWAHVSLLLGLAAAFTVLAVRTFERRDIAPGGAAQFTMRDLLQRIAGY